jgi:hypothetical protein
MLRQQVPEQALVPLAHAGTINGSRSCYRSLTLASDSIEKEPRQSFNDIVRKIGYMRMPVNLEVGASHLRITSVWISFNVHNEATHIYCRSARRQSRQVFCAIRPKSYL